MRWIHGALAREAIMKLSYRSKRDLECIYQQNIGSKRGGKKKKKKGSGRFQGEKKNEST